MSDVSDFDFWMGEWTVQNRRLRERLAGSDEWDEFEAESKAWPILGGLGNEDIYRTEHDGGFIGMSFRFFDPATREWSIYWADSRRPGLLDPPVIGSFTGDTGRLRGRRHVQGQADPRPLHLVAGDDADPALGAGVLGRRRRDLGDELGQRLHTDRRRRMNAVQAGYRHLTKAIAPAPGIELGGSALKWYDIAPADEPVPGPIRALARGSLRGAVDSGAIALDDDLGFVILHRCGESFYFLLVSTWRNDNELWETVWAKDGDASGFHPWPLEGTHRPTFCVWELGAVWHEQQAWSRFLRSERDAEARDAYLSDSYAGEV